MTTSRRDMIRKSAIAAGAVGATWTAPKVQGLSLRPDYAAAQSGPGFSNFNLATYGPDEFNVTTFVARPGTDQSVQIELNISGADGMLKLTGASLQDCAVTFDGTSAIAKPVNLQSQVATADQITANLMAGPSGSSIAIMGRLSCG